MSDNDKRPEQVEAQPMRPLPMPEYRYQDRGPIESSCSTTEERKSEKPDLSGVSLNLAW